MSGGARRWDRGPGSLVRLTGADALDLVQRLTTNDVGSLEPGRGAVTFFLERSGRIVDRVLLLVVDRGDGGAPAVALYGSAGRGPALAAWIAKHVITEDVVVEDVTARHAGCTVAGPGASAALDAALGTSSGDFRPGDHAAVPLGVARARVIRGEDVDGDCFHLLTPAPNEPALRERLAALPAGDDADWQAARITAGVPEWGAEFDEKTLPLELGDERALSFTKGCYVGQEVVSRLHRTGRTKRVLIRAAAPGETPPTVGSALEGGDPAAEVGIVTSAAPGPVGGSVLLARVRPEHAAPGATLTLTSSPDSAPGTRRVLVLPRFPTGDRA